MQLARLVITYDVFLNTDTHDHYFRAHTHTHKCFNQYLEMPSENISALKWMRNVLEILRI